MPTEWELNNEIIPQSQLKKTLGSTPKPVEVVGQGTAPQGEQGISDYNWQDTIRNYLADPLRGFARMGGEAVGGIAGIPFETLTGGVSVPAGILAGGTVADQAWQNTLGQISPRTFGGPSPNFGASLRTSALESLTDLGFTKGIPLLKSAVKKSVFSKFFTQDPNIPGINQALETLPADFKPTVGQATQTKFAKWLENVIVGERSRDARMASQQQLLKGKADELALDIAGTTRSNIPTTEQLGLGAGKSASDQYKIIHGIRKNLYDTAKNEIENSTSQGYRIVPPTPSNVINPLTGKPYPLGPPTLVETQLVGAVRPDKTIDFAKNTVLKDIDNYIADPNNVNYKIPEVKVTLDTLRNRVETFAKGDLVDSKGQPVMNYATAQADKEEFNNLFQKLPYDAKTRLAETVKTMRNLLSQDIKDSASNPDLGWTPQAKAALERANEYHIQTFKKLYGPTIAKKLAGAGKFTDAPDIIEENILNMGLKNATVAGEIVNASGTRVPLASEYLKRFFDASSDVNRNMVGEGGLNYLDKTKEIATKFLSADQRSALNNFARQIQISTFSKTQTPITSIMFRAGYLGLSVGSGLLAGNISGSAMTGVLAMATIPYAKGQLSKMMLNPANARLAAKLPKLAAGSPEATSIMKSLFKTGLRGLRFELQTATGTGLGLFEAQSDGKLHKVEPDNKIDIGPTVSKSLGWE